jgi:hypothetical protein
VRGLSHRNKDVTQIAGNCFARSRCEALPSLKRAHLRARNRVEGGVVVKNYEAITSTTAFAPVSLALTAVPTVPAQGSGVGMRMRDDQDATNGFLAWSPPV